MFGLAFKIIFRFTEDPLEFFDHERTVPNSVLKMFVDLFSSPQTASLFYTNDNKVLIDILVRQLSDLSPGDSVSVKAEPQNKQPLTDL